MIRFFVMFCFALLSSCTNAGGESIPFSKEGIGYLKGRDICNIEGHFSGELGVYLDGRSQQSVVYRERDGIIVIFLLSHPAVTERCGIIESVLDVTHFIEEDEFIEFRCYTTTEGGVTQDKWGRIVGIVNNDSGKNRIVTARIAWRVNVEKKQFEKISEKAECDTIGYADGE